jgi:hypothetical protein
VYTAHIFTHLALVTGETAMSYDLAVVGRGDPEACVYVPN